ncbi:MAG: ABC transporter substrate-binding protein [Actinobacteria bacterium]|nr:ABC transporter substrate-binding protein [Actinomycetota bacterium]
MKWNNKKTLSAVLILLLCAVALVVVAGCGGSTTTTSQASTGSTGAAQPTGEPVVIGAIVSATGPTAALGEQERNVLQMMEQLINGKGGVLGRPLKIVIEDDKSDPKEAVTAANRLIDQEKVVAMIASTGSPSTLAVKEITATKGMPQMAMAAANDVTDKAPADWIWRTPPKDALAVSKALDYVTNNLKVKKIAVLHDENAFGSSGSAEIEKDAPGLGLEIVANESYKTNDTDLTAQLTKIKGASPEALIVWGTNPGPALAAKNMKQLGMTIPYIGSHGIANATFIKLAEDAAEGVVLPASKLLVPSSITNADQKKVTDDFIHEYEVQFGGAPNPFAGYAFEAVSLLVNAINTAGSTDAKAIQSALNSTQNFWMPDGAYNYSATNHDGLVAEDMIMVRIQGGTWVLAQ